MRDAAASIDVRRLHRTGHVAEAAVSIRLTVATAAGAVSSDPVPLQWTPCNYGGERPWFTCPRCERRAAVLYAFRDDLELACRACRGLTYPTRRMTEPERLEYRARKFYAQAGSAPWADYHHKPKWMRWRTFNRLMDDAEAYSNMALLLAMHGNSFSRRMLPDAFALVQEYRADRKLLRRMRGVPAEDAS